MRIKGRMFTFQLNHIQFEMIIKYTTGKPPPNFFMLGFLLVTLSAIGLFNRELLSLITLPIAIPFLFTRTGILIDCDKKQIKKYTGLFAIKHGKWESIAKAEFLQVVRAQQTTSMSVLSIARNESNVIYKLRAVMPNTNIELLSGEGVFIGEAADHISEQLQIEIKNSIPRDKYFKSN